MTTAWPSRSGSTQALMQVLRQPARVSCLLPGELDLLLRTLRRARLLGRVGYDLRANDLLAGLDPVATDALTSAVTLAEARARAARWELDRLEWALRELPDVPIVALKGSAYLLAGTPNARGRMFADVDLLAPEQALGRVEQTLLDHGWAATELTPYDERYYRTWAHELPPLRHAEREVELDLHHNLLMRTARLKPSAARLLAAARPVPGSRFRVLAPVDMALHAITHLFYGGEIDESVRELVDVADLLAHGAATEPGFWAGFWPRALELDLVRPAWYGLRYAHALLGVDVPPDVFEEARRHAPGPLATALMDRWVPRVLLPGDVDTTARPGAVARTALYLRSHWVKMPPQVLLPHLARKTWVRWRATPGR